jgi:hypothetical protein
VPGDCASSLVLLSLSLHVAARQDMRRALLLVLLGAVLTAGRRTSLPPNPGTDTRESAKDGGGTVRKASRKRSPIKAPLVIGGGVAAVGAIGAVPGVRRAVTRLFTGGDGNLDTPPQEKQSKVGDSSGSPPVEKPSASSMRQEILKEAEQFQLTPERLATIAELNPNLEDIHALLAPVPVFTAAVGNGTSPLTVPAEDGRKLAYFFTEHDDAEAFLRAVRQSAGVDLDAQIIGVSLADIIRAYSGAEAKNAKETFVLIPTMAEVVAARQLMRAAGREDALAKDAPLGPGSGLVPVFWSEALAVQSAGGHQRKVIFFRVGDLQHMWRNLSDARKAAGELDEEMPEGPTVQVSDLQTMAKLLVQANKTDDVMFMPSSAALGYAQGQGAQRGQGSAASQAPRGSRAAAAAMSSSSDADFGSGDDDGGVDDFEGDDEDADGAI